MRLSVMTATESLEGRGTLTTHMRLPYLMYLAVAVDRVNAGVLCTGSTLHAANDTACCPWQAITVLCQGRRKTRRSGRGSVAGGEVS